MTSTKLISILSGLLIFIAGIVASAYSQTHTIAFYNVENLFDTLNTPNVNDSDFTPSGDKKWDSKKYKIKLDRLAEVIYFLGGDTDGPEVLGVCEIENRQVLEDLTTKTKLKNLGYDIIHYDSPDRRGIDVALLYKPRIFQPFHSHSISVRDPADPGFLTRDQLAVSGLFEGDTITFIVNHWPSRRGGGMDKRALAAQRVRAVVDSILAENKERKIILMGDFNDDPTDRSIRKHLGVTGKKKQLGNKYDLFNALEAPFKDGKGTLVYRGVANMFDQIIFSEAVLSDSEKANGSWFYKEGSGMPYVTEKMVQQDGQYRGYPYRTYSGNEFIGGYSDHWPVFIHLEKH